MPNGSMPLGNGAIALNAWVEPNGDLVFYIATTDAWDDNGRLLKVGRVRISLDPSPSTAAKFRQTLRLRDATLEAVVGRRWSGDGCPAVGGCESPGDPCHRRKSAAGCRPSRGSSCGERPPRR